MFAKHICDELKFYVYRLIDPRNGETFYIGKGTGNRVFAHVNDEVGAEADALTDKLQRIREIRLAGFEVAHVIHRHGMDEPTAFEVEAALIDAYPEVTNAVDGRASDERGVMHANQIVERYEAKEAVFEHKAVLINVNRSAGSLPMGRKGSQNVALVRSWDFTGRAGAMKRAAELAWLVVLLSGIASVAHAEVREVNVTGGRIQGVVAAGVASFKGIPFAAPPVARLRWRSPQTVIPWKGTRRADQFALPCAQPTWAARQSSEDCLYLNVWTAATRPDEQRPVMVWIHGGGFYTGEASNPAEDGTRFARSGVVLVSIAYRLGAFGFLAHPELSRESGAGSGDYGLEDQIAALRWVKQNIRQFGGDPDRVTLFGQSAGAQSVSLLAVSPLARGLFQRAIAESGAVFQPPGTTIATLRTLELGEATGEAFLRALGAGNIEEARALSTEALNRALQKPRFQEFGKFWPVLDGHVLPADDYTAFEDGRFNDVPILAGWNSNDGNGASDELPGGVSSSSWEHRMLNDFGPQIRSIIALYPHATSGAVIKANYALARDIGFGWPESTWARLETTKGRGKAFLYYFDVRSPDLPDGAIHTAEIPYVFGNSGVMGLFGTPLPPFMAADRRLSDLMQRYWVNFAATGDPNGPELPAWPAFTEHDPRVMYLDHHPGAGPVPNGKQLQALDEYFARRRTR